LIGPLAMWKLLPRAKDVRKRMQYLLEDERAKVLVLGGLVILEVQRLYRGRTTIHRVLTLA